MKQEVLDRFAIFTDRFEGHVPFMYLDVKGLVTTGRGNLIDPLSAALRLPWMRKDGSPADQPTITQEWLYVKSRTDLRLRGGMIYGSVTSLRLTEVAIDALTNSKLLEMESVIKSRFPNWDSLPWQAQLATMSLSWACGPAFRFPKFQAALLAGDCATCAVECQMDVTGNPGLIPRNAANKQLFLDAVAPEQPEVATYVEPEPESNC